MRNRKRALVMVVVSVAVAMLFLSFPGRLGPGFSSEKSETSGQDLPASFKSNCRQVAHQFVPASSQEPLDEVTVGNVTLQLPVWKLLRHDGPEHVQLDYERGSKAKEFKCLMVNGNETPKILFTFGRRDASVSDADCERYLSVARIRSFGVTVTSPATTRSLASN